MITVFKDHKIKAKFQTKANFVRGLDYIHFNTQKVLIYPEHFIETPGTIRLVKEN